MTAIVLVAAAALVDGDGRVLIGKRPAGKAMAGLWEFPGGKVEAGETPETCLIRELDEELGITVTGAKNPASARKIARTIAESPLVKTAFAGEDANWGRIVMAVGRADEPVNRDRMSVRFGDLVAAQDGTVSPAYDEAKMSAYMKRRELEVSVDVGVGRSQASFWTCDLTKRYVEINGDYRS